MPDTACRAARPDASAADQQSMPATSQLEWRAPGQGHVSVPSLGGSAALVWPGFGRARAGRACARSIIALHSGAFRGPTHMSHRASLIAWRGEMKFTAIHQPSPSEGSVDEQNTRTRRAQQHCKYQHHDFKLPRSTRLPHIASLYRTTSRQSSPR